MAHIFVIAGHGAGDSGATGGGYTEAERVRALASKIGQYGGSNVTIGDTSRNWYADNGISSLNIPKDWQIIELHMDSASASARGGHVIINSTFEPDDYDNALANFISKKFPGRSQSIVKRSDLANPKRAATKGYPYRLVECGFISNATDREIFNSDIDEIAKGILSAFGITSSDSNTGWIKDSVGWWWKEKDGSYPKKCWKLINGDYYYFNDKGYALCNQWLDYNGDWYYLKSDCRMAKGWLNLGGIYYYFNENLNAFPLGAMVYNLLITWKGKKYYLKDTGYMAKNETLKISGRQWEFDSSGVATLKE